MGSACYAGTGVRDVQQLGGLALGDFGAAVIDAHRLDLRVASKPRHHRQVGAGVQQVRHERGSGSTLGKLVHVGLLMAGGGAHGTLESAALLV